jgi:phage/plasmid-associated DNA primase
VCKQFYEEEDVGIMSNNIQRQFGLSDLVDKMIYIAPEIKRDFSMEQGEFQSIVSGDKVTVNIKFKQSRFETWKIPGVLAGNESPDFIDNSGSIQRRIVSVKFANKVREGDLMLGKKLKNEIPNIIQKCNKIYLEKSLKHGRHNIWTVLPTYFQDTRDLLAQATNPLIHFLCSGKLDFAKELYIPEKTFVQLFNAHCVDNNYTRHRFNPDFYMGPFYQKNITVQLASRKKYPIENGRNVTENFFIGVDVKREQVDDNLDIL